MQCLCRFVQLYTSHGTVITYNCYNLLSHMKVVTCFATSSFIGLILLILLFVIFALVTDPSRKRQKQMILSDIGETPWHTALRSCNSTVINNIKPLLNFTMNRMQFRVMPSKVEQYTFCTYSCSP